MTYALHSRTPRGPAVAWSVSQRDTFCQSLASLYALNEALNTRTVRVRRKKNCGSESAVDCDRSQHHHTGVYPSDTRPVRSRTRKNRAWGYAVVQLAARGPHPARQAILSGPRSLPNFVKI